MIAVPRTMACLVVSLVGALPKAQAFVLGARPLARTPPLAAAATAAAARGLATTATTTTATTTTAMVRPPLGRYRTGATPAHSSSATATPLRGLTSGSSALLFASGGGNMEAAAASAAAAAAGDGVKHVLVPVANGSEEIESVTIIDTLVRAGAAVTVASVGDDVEVVCSRGVKITADCKLAECEPRNWDAVVCPGGMPGATHLKESGTLEAILRKQDSDGRIVAAICAAPAVVLAAHGLLEGKKATCYPASAFTAQIPDLVNDKVVVDGNLITSQGPATAMAFALKLVESLFGPAKAEEVGSAMLFP